MDSPSIRAVLAVQTMAAMRAVLAVLTAIYESVFGKQIPIPRILWAAVHMGIKSVLGYLHKALVLLENPLKAPMIQTRTHKHVTAKLHEAILITDVA